MAVPKSFKRKLLWCIGLGAAVFLILSLYPERDELKASIQQFKWGYLPFALAMAAFNYLVRALRWKWYLHHLKIPLGWWESFSIFLIGLMLSVTPGKAGELFKAYLIKLSRGIPMSRTAPIVVMERLTDVTGTLILATSALAVIQVRGWMIAMLWLMLAFGLWVLTHRGLMGWAIGLFGRFTGKSVEGKIQHAYLSLTELLSPGCLLGGTALSTIAWFAECISLMAILQGFGVSIPWLEATFIYTFATLAGAVLFFLPGGIGGTEAAMLGLLREISHVPTAISSLATVLTRVVTLWFAAAIGFAALFFCPLPVAEDIDSELKRQDGEG